ncbi:MAG TPA: transcription termination/antitermination NusG family protein [Chthoniobacterales bacterium]|jgi:transcriptional antiterminator RfaH
MNNSNPNSSNNHFHEKSHLPDGSVEKAASPRSMIRALNFGIMTCSLAQLARIETALWFCLKTQPKHEHLAATSLRRHLQLKCFSPRVRFRKPTRRGAVWFVEAMFPGYLFAEFTFARQHRQVEYSSGIQGVVRFGDQIATVDPVLIQSLQEKAGAEEVVTFNPEIEVGQSVHIAEGPFQGVEALVTRLMPAQERIRVLLEFLGRSVEMEVSMPKVLPVGSPRG